MKRLFCAVLALLLMGAMCLPLMAAEPQHAGIARVTQSVHASVGADTPGAAVVLFENGDRILYEGYGYSDITARTLVTAETRFELGELSALFVALSAQKLVQEGKLELDRDVAYYLPGDFMKKLKLTHEITLQDLLAGRAGFADRYFDLRYENPSLVFEGLEEALLADVPAQVEVPGASYRFSRFGLTLAAFVVECVAQTDYATFVSEQILQPLGLTHTVLAPHTQEAQTMAAGHVNKGNGSFATAKDAGRTYSALWPADGAISSAADLSLLISSLLKDPAWAQILTLAFENGIFQTGMAGLAVSDTVRGLQAATAHYSASLCFDLASGSAILVLCNATDSALTDLPFAYYDFLRGSDAYTPADALPDPAVFEGEYVLREKTSASLYGRTLGNLRVSVDDAGGILWGDVRLVQVAPGIFADDTGNAVLQFQMSIEGEITGLITATGENYRPANLLGKDGGVRLLFVLLIIGALYFLLGGSMALADAILSRVRRMRHPRAWRFTVPWGLAAANALIVLVQILVCASFGTATIASFLTASATVSLMFVIGATCGFVYAIFTGFAVRRMTAKIARNAGIYLVFLLLCSYWEIILL